MKCLLEKFENILRKGENAILQHFNLFPESIQKLSGKSRLFGKANFYYACNYYYL